MDHITDFASGVDFIDLNGFGFAAANTAAITATNIKAAPFTSADVAGYFADGNAIHVEQGKTLAGAPTAQQIYIDVNHNGNFDAASDLVIHLDPGAIVKGVASTDFQFH
jgi:hypothetical protein